MGTKSNAAGVLSFVGVLTTLLPVTLGLRISGDHNGTDAKGNATQGQSTTFLGFYDAHTAGRGIWKWENALQAYQTHWAKLAGYPVHVAEIGVQSGGSMLMWKAVFGPTCHVYGLDINPKCLAFQDQSTTITIGDQGNPAMWQSFFSTTCTSLDILVDDGGHEAQQMVTTFNSVFPKLNPGGYVAIEDIHGAHYLQSFFQPTANFLAAQAQAGQLVSIHVYPFVLMAKKAGLSTTLPATELGFAGAAVTVDSFDALWKAVGTNKGGHVILQNAGWGPFFTAAGISNFFGHFNELHAGSWVSTPTGCAETSAAVCTNTMVNTMAQNLITGYHIYPTYVVVEVPMATPVIKAVRRGTEWIGYD